MKTWQHLKTITKHRWLVLKGCFRVGLYWQGLTHDLSKYSPTEFWIGAKYYQGTRSPNAAEREDKGYSEAWMHHKGRNRHTKQTSGTAVGQIAYPTPRGMMDSRCKQVSRLGLILLAHLPAFAVASMRFRPLHGYWDSPEISSAFP